jgi:hypothetical protein
MPEPPGRTASWGRDSLGCGKSASDEAHATSDAPRRGVWVGCQRQSVANGTGVDRADFPTHDIDATSATRASTRGTAALSPSDASTLRPIAGSGASSCSTAASR